MGERGESDRRVSEQSSLFTDVAEPKQMWGMGAALIRNIRKMESLKKGIDLSVLPAFF